MKKQRAHPLEIALGSFLAIALAGVMLVGAACENNAETDPGEGLPPRGDFYLVPSVAELEKGVDQAVFTVVGGQAPFAWAVENGTLGAIVPTGERSAVYQRTKLTRGVNKVTVTDATVLRAHASVIQD